MIVWNDCLIRSETRVGRMRTRDAHRQGGKSINHIDKNAKCHIFLPKCLVFYIYLVPKYTHYPYILI